MNTIVLWVGKTKDKRLVSLIDDYTDRINRYHRFEIQMIPDIKNKGKMSEKLQRQKEGQLILKKINPGDWVVLLDAKGKSLDISVDKFSNMTFVKYDLVSVSIILIEFPLERP